MASSAARRVIYDSSSYLHCLPSAGLETLLVSSVLAAGSAPLMSHCTSGLSACEGAAVSSSEASMEKKADVRRQWEYLIKQTRETLASVPEAVSLLTSPNESQSKFARLGTTSWHKRGGDWPYKNEYIWQGRKGDRRMVSLAEGSEPKTKQFFVAQKVLSIDPKSNAAVLPSLAIAATADESKTVQLIHELAHTLRELYEKGDSSAEVALEAICSKWPIRFPSRSLKALAKQSLLERFHALQAECDSWIVHDSRKRKATSIPQTDLNAIWKSLKKCDYGSKREKLQLLKAMTKCLRKIAKVVSKRIGPAPAAVEHCVDEIFTTMPAVVDTYRCKLMRSFIIKSRLQLAGFEFEHSDLEKIKRLRDLREQIFNPENRKVPTSFLGVHFSTLQALEVVSFLVQQMWEQDHKALLHDWYESSNELLSRSDDDGLMVWIVKTLAEVGSERSLTCLYTLFCQAQNATLVVHKDLRNFLIYRNPSEQNTPTRVVQIHTPKGCEHRAIHLVDANGEVVDAGEVQSSTLRESFGLSLKADSDQALC